MADLKNEEIARFDKNVEASKLCVVHFPSHSLMSSLEKKEKKAIIAWTLRSILYSVWSPIMLRQWDANTKQQTFAWIEFQEILRQKSPFGKLQSRWRVRLQADRYLRHGLSPVIINMAWCPRTLKWFPRRSRALTPRTKLMASIKFDFPANSQYMKCQHIFWWWSSLPRTKASTDQLHWAQWQQRIV